MKVGEQVTEATVGSNGVVVDAPRLDDPPDLGDRGEDVLVEALVTEPAVEAFDEGILHRLARGDVVPLDAPLGRPAQHGIAGQLGCRSTLSETIIAGLPRITISSASHAS